MKVLLKGAIYYTTKDTLIGTLFEIQLHCASSFSPWWNSHWTIGQNPLIIMYTNLNVNNHHVPIINKQKKILISFLVLGSIWCWRPIVSHSSTIAWIWNIACTTSCENYLLVCNSRNYSTCACDVTKQFMGWENLESKICHT